MPTSGPVVQRVVAPSDRSLGTWRPGPGARVFDDPDHCRLAVGDPDAPLWIVTDPLRADAARWCLADGGTLSRPIAPDAAMDGGDGHGQPLMRSHRVLGTVPAIRPENLGDPGFLACHGLRYPLMMGSMANGISSVAAVITLGHAGMLGSFGAAGQTLPVVEAALAELGQQLGERPYAANLIHSPHEPDLEAALVDLYLRHRLRLIEASAFLELTLPVVRFRLRGIHRTADGRIVAPNRVIAKVSRVEVATRFLSPAPEKLVHELVRRGELTTEQAALAASLPMCDDLTAEADSGGHTDNRPAIALLPTMLALRDRLQERFAYTAPPRVGLGGGIATPASTAAAFAMGAAYVVIGSVAQACRESGVAPEVRRMLAEAEQADVAMAPAADMFEMGVNVQVLKRGTMFAMRAAKLYEVYRAHEAIEQIPTATRAQLERTIFQASIDEVWRQTVAFFTHRDPGQLERAAREPKHRLALVCRWYLGQASRWAVAGDPQRRLDYQVWCGPAMGAFNEWVKGSYLQDVDQRDLCTVARNLLLGACVHLRWQAIRQQGGAVPPGLDRITPIPRDELARHFPA